MNKRMAAIAAIIFASCMAWAGVRPDVPYSSLQGDTLVIGNGLIERKFVWNGGNLMTYSLADKVAGKVHKNLSLTPDFVVTHYKGPGENGKVSVVEVLENLIHPAYHKTIVEYSLGALSVRREFRVYKDSPVIACDTWLRGSMSPVASEGNTNNADRKNIEFKEDMQSKPVTAVLDQFNFAGQHWHAKAVEFWDVSDWNNNLLAERDIIAYRKNNYRGNLLFVRNGVDGSGFFFLKEAPCSSVQLAYKGVDFMAEFGKFTVTGLGVTENDVNDNGWTSAYSCVTGVYDGGEFEALKALRSYQKNIRRHIPERDEMIMMNTWGDRSQDSKVNEKFCLEELEKAARLGVTHFQIDDGWQVGKSPNSAVARGSFKNIWDNPDYWTPDPVKYPRGLTPIVEKGKELGIEIGLWFNPSVQNDFADWEKDAGAIVKLYRQYGIKVYKIDGLTIATKQAEINLRRLFDKVLEQTDNQVMFNLDATASRRGGYHLFNEYGNIFLENRYSDWGNYYPYWTLRNLWQLSKYVPAEKLQIEFLNKWRNEDKYKGDPFGPANYSFEYIFAVAMAGQPLAWMEASNLPEEAYGLNALIGQYKKVQADFHGGVILPVGDEPDGRSWTGFQSVTGDKTGYMLVYREDNRQGSALVKTWLPEGVSVKFTLVLGHGKGFNARTAQNGAVRFSLPQKNDFVMYRYEIQNERVAFMGDSITENWRKSTVGHPYFFEDNNYLNKGISGQNSTQIRNRFMKDIVAASPECVVICCGTNDIAGNGGETTNEYVIDNIEAMARMAENAGIKVILCSVLPCNYYYWKPAVHPEKRIADLNRRIKALAARNNWEYVDYYTPMADRQRALKKEYQNDACHPNKAGYTLMESIVKPVIDKVLE